MAGFPLDPVYSKILLSSAKHSCVAEMISIISMLSIDPVFYSPREKREEAGEARKQFMSLDGDHLMLLNVLKAYQSVGGNSQWCSDHFISHRSMKQIMVSLQYTGTHSYIMMTHLLTTGHSTTID
jgi:HrpA-like RNA helicase